MQKNAYIERFCVFKKRVLYVLSSKNLLYRDHTESLKPKYINKTDALKIAKQNKIPTSSNDMVELRKKIRDFYKKANKKERTIDGVEFQCATACALLSSDEDSAIIAVSDVGSSVILKIEIKKKHLHLSASVLFSYSTEAKIPVS